VLRTIVPRRLNTIPRSLQAHHGAVALRLALALRKAVMVRQNEQLAGLLEAHAGARAEAATGAGGKRARDLEAALATERTRAGAAESRAHTFEQEAAALHERPLQVQAWCNEGGSELLAGLGSARARAAELQAVRDAAAAQHADATAAAEAERQGWKQQVEQLAAEQAAAQEQHTAAMSRLQAKLAAEHEKAIACVAQADQAQERARVALASRDEALAAASMLRAHSLEAQVRTRFWADVCPACIKLISE
jgi:hypothetical protein